MNILFAYAVIIFVSYLLAIALYLSLSIAYPISEPDALTL